MFESAKFSDINKNKLVCDTDTTDSQCLRLLEPKMVKFLLSRVGQDNY